MWRTVSGFSSTSPQIGQVTGASPVFRVALDVPQGLGCHRLTEIDLRPSGRRRSRHFHQIDRTFHAGSPRVHQILGCREIGMDGSHRDMDGSYRDMDGSRHGAGCRCRGGNRPLLGVNHPPRGVNRPPRGTNRPSRGANRPPPGVNRPTRGANRPTRGPNRPPLGANRPYFGAGRPLDLTGSGGGVCRY
jgi:hypothetical protein